MFMNRVFIAGRIGRDIELRQTGNGMSVATISVATNESYKDKEGNWQKNTEWHRVTAFGKKAETIAKHFQKGSRIYLEGKLKTNSWEKDGQKQYRIDIILSEFQFVDSKSDAGQQQSPQSKQNDFGGDGGNDFGGDDDVPF